MISLFEKVKEKDAIPKQNISESEFFEGVKNGRWQDSVLNYRIGKLEKTNLMALTPSGVFKVRNSKGLIEHSGLICIDVDAKDQVCVLDIEQLKEDSYVHCMHDSVSGNGGYAIYIRIDGNKHLEAFLGIEEYLFINYSIVIDKACKDVSRLRFVSFDPHLFINEKSKVFKKYLKKKDIIIRETKQFVVKSDFDEMVMTAKGMNLFDSYEDYLKLGFGLASEFKYEGRDYFHALCSSSSKYDYKKVDEDYTKICKRDATGISISSVYYKFKEAGISIFSEKTKQIKSIVRLTDNPKEVLKELKINDDENIIGRLTENKKEEETELSLIIDLIKFSKVRFNEITRNFEFGNEEMTDRILAKFYTTVWQKIDDGISKDKVFTLIQNRDNSKSYNPIHEWFDKNKHIECGGQFEELTKCFHIDHIIYDENGNHEVIDYLDVYLKKWMLGLIGSAFGTYSLMILVLSGEQGIKKTEFFRNLFPAELKKFYAESNLDDGKDSEILMTKKWLIVDDEFGGKTKKDATKLKRLSSQQTFSVRMPYGKVSEDLNRLSVLGGTSNDYDVINDPTGNRRIIPINLISFDFERYVKIDKTKLFIELYNEWEKDKKGWFLNKQEIEFLNKSTTKNTEVMGEVELIQKHLKIDAYGSMTNTEIKLEFEKLYPSFRTTNKRMGQALKICTFEQHIKCLNGKTRRVYNVIFN